MSEDITKDKYFVKEVLEEYQNKIFKGNYKLYSGFPLNKEDTIKCKIFAENLDFLRNAVYLNAYKNLGYDINDSFGIGKDTSIIDIPEHVPTRTKQQNYPFPLSDEFRFSLLKNPKFKFYETEKTGIVKGFTKNTEYKSVASYYITKINNPKSKKQKEQLVVIKVITDYLNEKGSDFLPQYCYSDVNIQALLGKKCKKILTLARFDYVENEANHGHQNFLDENDKVIDFGTKNWNKHLIRGSHFHIQKEIFELLNPNCLGSGDAYPIDSEDKNFLELKEDFLKKLNFVDYGYNFNKETNINDIYAFLSKKYEKDKGEENERI